MWKHVARIGGIVALGIGAAIVADMIWPESDDKSSTKLPESCPIEPEVVSESLE